MFWEHVHIKVHIGKLEAGAHNEKAKALVDWQFTVMLGTCKHGLNGQFNVIPQVCPGRAICSNRLVCGTLDVAEGRIVK